MSIWPRRSVFLSALLVGLPSTSALFAADKPGTITIDWATYNPVSIVLKNKGLLEKEFAKDGIAVNSLWPISTIDTAAVRNLLGGATVAAMSRSPDIMADAAHAIFLRSSREATGNFYIDEEVLRAEGVSDFSVYAPGATGPLAGDFFVPDEVFANSQTKVKRIY